MRTILDKYNHYMRLINEKELEFINTNIKNIPSYIYKVNRTGIITLNITGIHYRNELYPKYCNKITKEDVKKVKAYYENMPNLIIDKISLDYERIEQSYKSYGAIKYLDMIENYFLTKEDADKKVAELTEIKLKEEYLLNNNHLKCAYCGKIVHIKDSIDYEIIFQNSKPDMMSKTGWKNSLIEKETDIVQKNVHLMIRWLTKVNKNYYFN